MGGVAARSSCNLSWREARALKRCTCDKYELRRRAGKSNWPEWTLGKNSGDVNKTQQSPGEKWQRKLKQESSNGVTPRREEGFMTGAAAATGSQERNQKSHWGGGVIYTEGSSARNPTTGDPKTRGGPAVYKNVCNRKGTETDGP